MSNEQFFLFLAMEPSFYKEWTPIFISFCTVIITAAISVFSTRGKQKTDDFTAIIGERKEFTAEIREELKRKQAEFQQRVLELEEVIQELRVALEEREQKMGVMEKEISQLRNSVLTRK